MNIAVIIPAAGSSRRFSESAAADLGVADAGFSRSKLDEELGGRPVLQRTVELFSKHPDVMLTIVAGPADAGAFAEFKARYGDKLGLLGVRVCQGGATHRYETVANALGLVPDDGSITHVAVHDAARPCASPELIERVFAAAGEGHRAVVPGLDVPDTLKRVGEKPVEAKADPLAAILGDAGKGRTIGRTVEATVDRARLVAVQTPQMFELGLLRRAYAQKDLGSTDDAQLVERLGEPVVVVPGEAGNIKITRYSDVKLARAILGVKGADGREAHKRF
ncbi:MAG: 2-C-methyl-D-erythritol 4-phosphate cytidylyltransferase [Phycisphaerales bacterium]|nr:2-C-methyl-D-erythritol 4-phosphate cytidylyltransferase [Phycisphaerales bacterium]